VEKISHPPSQALPAPLEGLAPAFHHAADLFAYWVLLKCTALDHTALPASKVEHVHQLSVAVDNDIGIVSYDDELPV
jgi:hypothetical protein